MSGDKTEKATPKKLKDLRKKGSAARSVELPQGVTLVALVLVLPSLLHRLLAALRGDMAVVLGGADVDGIGAAHALANLVLLDAVRAVAPGIAVVGTVGLLSGVVVTRSRPNPAAVKPQAARLNPGKAIKHMLSTHSVVELLKMTTKLAVLVTVSVGAWKSGYARLLASGADLDRLQAIAGDATTSLLWRVALLALGVGVADAWWQRRSFGKQSRMSHQDIKEEHKQADGNPAMKAHIRGRMLAAARNRMISAVPKADVVLANPTHLVVALSYTAGSSAPVVVAKGAGAVADRIKAVALEAGVPILVDKPLARAIYRATEVGDIIPGEMFRAVAEVLAVVFAAKRRGTLPVWRAA